MRGTEVQQTIQPCPFPGNSILDGSIVASCYYFIIPTVIIKGELQFDAPSRAFSTARTRITTELYGRRQWDSQARSRKRWRCCNVLLHLTLPLCYPISAKLFEMHQCCSPCLKWHKPEEHKSICKTQSSNSALLARTEQGNICQALYTGWLNELPVTGTSVAPLIWQPGDSELPQGDAGPPQHCPAMPEPALSHTQLLSAHPIHTSISSGIELGQSKNPELTGFCRQHENKTWFALRSIASTANVFGTDLLHFYSTSICDDFLLQLHWEQKISVTATLCSGPHKYRAKFLSVIQGFYHLIPTETWEWICTNNRDSMRQGWEFWNGCVRLELLELLTSATCRVNSENI